MSIALGTVELLELASERCKSIDRGMMEGNGRA